MESNLNRTVFCDSCGAAIDITEIELLPQIVSKDIVQVVDGVQRTKKIVAVRYYFACVNCGYEYTCFYKDALVNKLFAQDQVSQAQYVMDKLWEIFEDE